MSELTANETFYVRTDGNDTNNGLTSGNAFLTLQRAADETKKWRTGEFTLTVDIGKGLFGISSDLDTGHPDGHNVYWTGVATEMTTGDMFFTYLPGNITMPEHEGISYRSIFAHLPENELPQAYPTNDWLFVRDASNGTNPRFLHGAHHLVSWMMPQASAEFIWRYNDDDENALPGGEPIFEDVVMLIQTMLRPYNGASLRSSNGRHCGNWDNMIFDGLASDVPLIWMSDRSEIVLGSHFGTYSGEPALLCQSNAVIHADESVHMLSYGECMVLAESGGFISLRDAVISTTENEAVIARDNGTIDLQGTELLYTGYPCSVKATRCGSVNAANTIVLGCVSDSIAFYMDTEGYIDSTDAVTDAETTRNPVIDPSDKQLTANKTFYVRTTGNDSNDGTSANTAFLTPSRAVEEVKRYFIGVYTVSVDIGEGTFNCATALNPGSSEGRSITWTGAATAYTNRTINNIDGSTTSLAAGLNYIDFDVSLPAASGAAVGQYILIKTTSGGTNPNLVKGCHKIVTWNGATNIATVRCARTDSSTTLPSGTITANALTLVKSVFSFSGGNGIFSSGALDCGTWDQLVLEGTAAYAGIWMAWQSTIVIGGNFGTSNWGTNVQSQYNATVTADGSVHSYSHGYLASVSDAGTLALRGAILSGSAVLAARAYDGGMLNFHSGEVYCGGHPFNVQAQRGGYITASFSIIEGCVAGSVACYATSGGGIIANSVTTDATLSHDTGATPGGNGAYVAY